MVSARKRRLGSAAIVTDTHNSIVLGVRDKDPNRGRWVLPGGKVEPGETIARACVREFWEETHMSISLVEFLGVWEADADFLVAVHLAVAGHDPLPREQESDLLRPTWVTRQALPELDITEVCVSILTETGWL